MAEKNFAYKLVIGAKDEASAVFGSLRAKVAGVAAAITAYFSARIFSDAVGSAAEFEAALSRVQAASGASAGELEQLRAAADAAGTNTKFTATEAAGALETLAKSGLSASDSVAALGPVLTLAQSGGVELGAAAEFVTKAVNGMGLSFGEAGRVADVLAKGANASNTSVEGLAQALSFAAPVANSLGLSLEQTVAIIGKFADAGIDAGRAGTALNSILSQFSDPASKFRRELGEAGIVTDDFNKALRQLATSGPEGSKAILAVGQEAGPALRALLNQGVGSLDELTSALEHAKGSAQATAAVMADNLDGAVTGLGSAWDALRRALVDPLLEPIKDQVVALTDRLREFVTSGAAARIGEAFRNAFEAASAHFSAFLAKIDLEALVAQVSAFADRSGEAFKSFGEQAAAAGNAAQLAFGVMSTGANTLLAALYKLAEGASTVSASVLDGLAALREGLAKVSFGDLAKSFEQSARDIRVSAEGMRGVAKAFSDESRSAFDAAARGADRAAEGWRGLTAGVAAANDEVRAVEPAVAALGQSAGISADQLDALGDGAEVVAGQVREVAAQAGAAAPALRKVGDDGAEAALRLEQAFKTLGVTSQSSLRETAEKAKQAYETIKASGTATAEDLRAAFTAYAQKAIEANGGVADEVLQVEAALRGVRIEAGGLGEHVGREFDRMGRSARDAAGAIRDISDSERRLRDSRQILSKPGAAGDVLNLPDGLTDEQMRELNFTSRQREDYLLNRNLTPEERAAGVVKRSVSVSSTDNTAWAYRLGLSDPDQVAMFAEVIGGLQASYRARALKNLRGTGTVGAKTLQTALMESSKNATREALRIARAGGETRVAVGSQRASSETGSSTPARTVRLDINLNGRNTAVDMASERDAERIIGVLREFKARS